MVLVPLLRSYLNDLLFRQIPDLILQFFFQVVPTHPDKFEHWVHFIEAAIALALVTGFFARLRSADTAWLQNYLNKTRSYWELRNIDFQNDLAQVMASIFKAHAEAIANAHHFFVKVSIRVAFVGGLLLYVEALHPDALVPPGMQIAFAAVLIAPLPLGTFYSTTFRFWTRVRINVALRKTWRAYVVSLLRSKTSRSSERIMRGLAGFVVRCGNLFFDLGKTASELGMKLTASGQSLLSRTDGGRKPEDEEANSRKSDVSGSPLERIEPPVEHDGKDEGG